MLVTLPAIGTGFVTLTAATMLVTFPAIGAGFVTLTGAVAGCPAGG